MSIGIASQLPSGKRYQLDDVRTVSTLNLPLQTIDCQEVISKYPHLRDIPFQEYCNAVPKILIGIDNWKLCTHSEVREGRWKEPVASKTRLGWTIHGQYHQHSENVLTTTHHSYHTCECKKDNVLHGMIKDFFSLENFGVIPTITIESPDERRANNILKETTVLNNKRYETGLL